MEPISENAAEPSDQLKQQAQPLAQHVQQTAGHVADQARSRAETQKDRATQSLTSTAHALRQTGQHLEDQGERAVGQAMDKSAGQIERLAEYVERRDVSQLIGEAEDFARRQPTLFLGAAFAMGFAASRFLKSSPPDQSMASDYDTIAPTTDVGQQDEDVQETLEAIRFS